MEKTVTFEEVFPTGTTAWALAAETSYTLGPAKVSKIRELVVYVFFGVGTTAGVVTVEGAGYAEATGTWVSLGTATWSVASKWHSVAVTGIHGAVRIRVSTAIAGGDGIRVFAGGN